MVHPWWLNTSLVATFGVYIFSGLFIYGMVHPWWLNTSLVANLYMAWYNRDGHYYYAKLATGGRNHFVNIVN